MRAALLASLLIVPLLAGPVRAQFGQRLGNTDVGVGIIDNGEGDSDRDSMRRRCRELLGSARDALEADRLGLARQHLELAERLAVTSSLAQEVAQVYGELERRGAARLAEVQRLYDAGQYVEALERCGQATRELGLRVPSGQAAQRGLRRLEADPDVRLAVDEGKAAAMYAGVAGLLEAQRRQAAAAPGTQPASAPASAPADAGGDDLHTVLAMPVEHQARVLELLGTLVQLYPATPTGRQAATLLARLRQDPDLARALAVHGAQRQAQQALNTARMYHRAGMYAQATERYHQVLQQHPGTPQARQAESDLSLAISARPLPEP